MDVDPELLKAALNIGLKMAAEAVASAAERYVKEIGAWMKKPDPEQVARLAVARVMAEAAAFPPRKALSVLLHSGPAEAGNDASAILEKDRASLSLLIWNRADFSVELAKLRGVLKVSDGDKTFTYEIDSPSKFDVDARSEKRVAATALLSRTDPIPAFAYGSVLATLSLDALVVGPWDDEPHNVHTFDVGRVWLRVAPELIGSNQIEYDDTDAIHMLNAWVGEITETTVRSCGGGFFAKPVDVPKLDTYFKVRPGTVARLVPRVLEGWGWKVESRGARTMFIVPMPPLAAKIASGLW